MIKARARFVTPLLILLALAPYAVLAIDAPPPGFIQENPTFVAWGFGVLISVVVALLGMKIHADSKKQDADAENNNRQWRAINNHETRISMIEGAHSVNHPPMFRRYEDDDR